MSERKGELTATKNQQVKADIAKAISEKGFDRSGRCHKKWLLEKCEVEEVSKGGDVYVVADDDVIMKKAKQLLWEKVLREKAPQEKPDKSMGHNSARGQWVRVEEQNNVLFGTCHRTTNHEGNIQIRELVSQRKGEYMATKSHKSRPTLPKPLLKRYWTNLGAFSKK